MNILYLLIGVSLLAKPYWEQPRLDQLALLVNGEFSNPPAEPWFFIGGWMVSQPDSIWMEEFDAIIFDVTDAALADRNVWDGAFWQPKVYTEQGCTYTITYTLRTDEAQGRDVIVFLENTDDNYNKFIEELKRT